MLRPGEIATLLAALLLAGALGAGCVISPARYHYPRGSGEVDAALDRLLLQVEASEGEGAASPLHAEAKRAALRCRQALDQDPLVVDAIARDLLSSAEALEAIAVRARGEISKAAPSPVPEGRTAINFDRLAGRDRLFDLERLTLRAAREARVLRREIADLPLHEEPRPPGPKGAS